MLIKVKHICEYLCDATCDHFPLMINSATNGSFPLNNHKNY